MRQLQLLQPPGYPPPPSSHAASFLRMDSLSLPKWLTSPSLSLAQFSANQDRPSPPPAAETLNGKVLAFSDV